jgi:UDP:flavonoid glycosyltransferase YjiC (YdhE family)
MQTDRNVHILYCVLNWGLGHATRSVPVIRALQTSGCAVEIASDGDPLKLLQKTFPGIVTHILPSYDIQYPSRHVLINVLSQARRMTSAISAEYEEIQKLKQARKYDAIISDNRYGCHSQALTSILISHQLRNLAHSAIISKPGEWFVDRHLKRFNEVWVPDTPDRTLSGKLTEYRSEKLHFVGHLSDQKREICEKTNLIVAMLSGPEPQRSNFEQELKTQLQTLTEPCVLVRGIVEDTKPVTIGCLTVYPFKDRSDVNALLNNSEIVICRSGYSSVMDLLQVGTKAILVPTPGQPEQEYLAERLKDHPQFVIQQQHELNVREGFRRLAERPEVTPAECNNKLLGDAISRIRKQIHS